MSHTNGVSVNYSGGESGFFEMRLHSLYDMFSFFFTETCTPELLLSYYYYIRNSIIEVISYYAREKAILNRSYYRRRNIGIDVGWTIRM